MNKNTISLPSIDIEIQKLTPLQFQLLQLVDKSEPDLEVFSLLPHTPSFEIRKSFAFVSNSLAFL